MVAISEFVGTCQLQLQVASPDADGSQKKLLSGNLMRQMALLVIEKCIIPQITGGYMTRVFGNNSIMSPRSRASIETHVVRTAKGYSAFFIKNRALMLTFKLHVQPCRMSEGPVATSMKLIGLI